MPSGREGRLERRHIAPERVGPDADVVLPPRNDHVIAAGPPQEVERAAQRAARMLAIQVGPEEADKRIASTEAAGRREGEVGKEGEALGLLQDGTDFRARRITKVEGTQEPQFEQSAS